MKGFLVRSAVILLLAGAAFSAGCGPTAEAEQRRHRESGGDFSFIPPEGWMVDEMPGLKYKIARGTPDRGFTNNMNFVDQDFAGPLDSYVDGNLQALEKIMNGFSMSSRDDLKTDTGERCIRLVTESIFNGTALEQRFYFFENGRKKIVLTCSRLAGSSPELDAAFDASAKTFRFH
jgi:hypothetical protein